MAILIDYLEISFAAENKCTQEHYYCHTELGLKYQDTGNGWTFVL